MYYPSQYRCCSAVHTAPKSWGAYAVDRPPGRKREAYFFTALQWLVQPAPSADTSDTPIHRYQPNTAFKQRSAGHRLLRRVKIMPEAIVMVDHVCNKLIATVAIDVVATPALRQENLSAIKTSARARRTARIRQRKSGNRLAHGTHRINKLWCVFAMHHFQLHAGDSPSCRGIELCRPSQQHCYTLFTHWHSRYKRPVAGNQ